MERRARIEPCYEPLKASALMWHQLPLMCQWLQQVRLDPGREKYTSGPGRLESTTSLGQWTRMHNPLTGNEGGGAKSWGI